MARLSAQAWLAEQARDVRAWLALSIVAGVLATMAVIAQAASMAQLVALALGDSPPRVWIPAAGILAAAVLGRSLGQWGHSAAGTVAAARVRRRLRERLWSAIGAAGPVGVSDIPPGDTAARIVDRVDALEGYFARYRPQLVLAAVSPLAVLAVVAALDWLAALLLLAAAPLIPLFMALVGMGADELNRRQAEWVNHLAGQFLDRVRGLVTLQLFRRERAAIADVEHGAQAYRRLTMRTLRVAFLSSAVLELFASVAIAVVAIYVGFALLGSIQFGPADELELFEGLFVLLLAPEFFQPLRDLAQHYHDRAAAVGTAPGIQAILERGPARRTDDARETSPPDPDRGVAIAGATLSYGDGPTVLEAVDLAVAAGETVVLSGPSGGGKTTVLAALAGFIRPSGGHVSIAGCAAGAAGTCAWVGQRPWLLPASLRANIRIGDPTASDPAIAEAAEAADVASFARRTPAGLDARVGEGGYGLSGGQGQRVALARAFVSPAPVVLLDEPTAQLDPDAAARVIAGLRRLQRAGRTLIIAGHDPRLAALAQRRLRVAGGRLTEVRADA